MLLITDSMSAVEKLGTMQPDGSEDLGMFEAVNGLARRVRVTIRHVKAHVGVKMRRIGWRTWGKNWSSFRTYGGVVVRALDLAEGALGHRISLEESFLRGTLSSREVR